MTTNKNIINNDQIKTENRYAVLKLLFRQGAMSRSELTQALNCDGTTITHISRFLMDEGLIKSLGYSKTNKKRGRPQELISLNENSCSSIGISFSPHGLVGVLVDFSGNIIFQENICFERNIQKNYFKELLQQLTQKLLDRLNNRKLLGLGLGTFGVYSAEKKCITQAEYFTAVCNINFKKLFQDEYEITPDIIDGTFAQSIVERHNRRNDMPTSFIMLNASIGIGAAIFIDSHPLLTERGFYNEFGHSVFKPEGEMCEAGHRGCLETLASIPAIKRKVSAKLDDDKMNFEHIRERYLNGDPLVMEIVNEAAKWLGIATSNLVNLFSPREIILSGMSAQFGESFMRIIEATVRDLCIPELSRNVSFSLSELDKDVAAYGVALVQLQNFFAGNTDVSMRE